jgi:hypothetical protein
MSTLKRLVLMAALTLCFGSACKGPETLCNANEGEICHDCPGEAVTCSFEGVEATERSCEECQARWALYHELCEAGSEATVEEVEAGMLCEAVGDTGS